MEKYNLQNLPKLDGDNVVIKSEVLKTFVEYMNKQSEVIDKLSEAITNLDKLCEKHSITISTLKSHISTLADVIGGQIDA